MEITIHNVETGEIEIRLMNDIEKENLKGALAETEAQKKELETKAANRAALLVKLGLSEDEARLILS